MPTCPLDLEGQVVVADERASGHGAQGGGRENIGPPLVDDGTSEGQDTPRPRDKEETAHETVVIDGVRRGKSNDDDVEQVAEMEEESKVKGDDQQRELQGHEAEGAHADAAGGKGEGVQNRCSRRIARGEDEKGRDKLNKEKRANRRGQHGLVFDELAEADAPARTARVESIRLCQRHAKRCRAQLGNPSLLRITTRVRVRLRDINPKITFLIKYLSIFFLLPDKLVNLGGHGSPAVARVGYGAVRPDAVARMSAGRGHIEQHFPGRSARYCHCSSSCCCCYCCCRRRLIRPAKKCRQRRRRGQPARLQRLLLVLDQQALLATIRPLVVLPLLFLVVVATAAAAVAASPAVTRPPPAIGEWE